MSVSIPLQHQPEAQARGSFPPSGRDFLAYQRVVVDAASTRTVADELQISQTRVRQIVRRVIDWMQQNLPEDNEMSEAAQLRVARHIAADRLERYFCEADCAWRQTGQIKYANVVLKVISAQIKLPAMAGTIEALAMDAIIGPLPEEVGQTFLSAKENDELKDNTSLSTKSAPAKPVASHHKMADKNVCPTFPPPPRDCSPNTPPQPPAAENSAPPAAIMPTPQTPSDDLPPTKSAARKAFLASAHSSNDNGDNTAVTELRITPQTLGLSAKKHLNRRERRRLHRLATTK